MLCVTLFLCISVLRNIRFYGNYIFLEEALKNINTE